MSRYIDADKLALFIVEHLPRSAPQDAYDAYFDVMRMLKDERATPTADVEEVKHGKPIVYEVHGRYVTGAAVDETKMPFLVRKEYVEKRERCPFCNATLFGEWGYYCDKCGAKMDKEKEK